MSTHLTTLGQLAERFFAWSAAEVAGGRSRPRTLDYYRRWVGRFVDLVGADRPLAELIPWDLERHKAGWHSVQAVQRLFNWAQSVELVERNPFRGVKRPRPGQRQRVLSRRETARLLRATFPEFRSFLVGMRHTMARPQELAQLRWSQLRSDGKAFELVSFKGKERRRDGAVVRVIVLDSFMRRMVRRRRGSPDDFVFTNSQGKPWTGNALRCAMRRARVKAGLVDGGELVVCYTMRHTAATEATARGVRDRTLADLMGHSSTRTTARYQHLRADHLVEAIDQATARGGRKRA